MNAVELIPVLEPLPYQEALADHLSVAEAAAWTWYSEDLTGPEYAESVRLELLKTTYRIERTSKPDLYALADRVLRRLDVDAPITMYQMQRAPTDSLNAALFYIPGEIHVAFVGPLLESLQTNEVTALIGHEVAHFLLLECSNHKYRILEELLHTLLQDQSSQPVHVESYRLFHLYKEIFCDRAALRACGDLGDAIALLVKVETGATDVNPESYLRQTEEVFSKDTVTTEGLSHPECYIRAQALKLWSEQGAAAEDTIRSMIEGGLSLQGLDLLSQQVILDLTRRLLNALLAEHWIRSDEVMAHAHLFFEDFAPPESRAVSDDMLQPIMAIKDEKLRAYFCYVLLDFAACDREQEESALAAALLLSRRLGFDAQFRRLATKELKLKKRNFDLLEDQAEEILAAARGSEGES